MDIMYFGLAIMFGGIGCMCICIGASKISDCDRKEENHRELEKKV